MKKLYLLPLLLVFFSNGLWAQTDTTIGTRAPKKVSRDVKKLAHYLCDTVQGDFGKVTRVYRWVTHNIKYDVAALKKGALKRPTIKQVLKHKKALCDGYSDLFAQLCNEAGVQAITVSGYARDWMFDDSDKFYKPRHAWNAVAIGGNWHLVDATWGAGVIGQFPNKIQQKLIKLNKNPALQVGKLKFKYQYDGSWLLMAPATFRLNHAPYDPIWQMTDSLMPLSIFEAGEAPIITFNNTYGRKTMNVKELDRYSLLPEHSKTIEKAERAYAYNPRFYVSRAMQHLANAVDSISTLDKYAPRALRNAVIDKVKVELTEAEKYVALQKESISTEYTELKRKNKIKSTSAKTYINAVNGNNKQAIARCKNKIRSSDKKYNTLGQKAGTAVAAHKKVKPTAFEILKTISPSENNKSARLTALEDSVQTRFAQLNDQYSGIMAQHHTIDSLVAANKQRLDTLVYFLALSDSAMIQETIGRIKLQDNYDVGVKKWTALYKDARTQHADTLQHYYLATYDTLLVHYEGLRKDYAKYLQQYQKNFKDLSQYKSRNNSNQTLLSLYAEQMKSYPSAYEAEQQMMVDFGAYLKGNKGLMERLVKHYEHQGKLADYMEKAEKQRKKLEETSLVKKEAFDKKENAQQKKQLEEAATQAEGFINKKDKS